MTTLREAAQMALDALELVDGYVMGKHEAKEALYEALAQPEQDDGYCQACEGNYCTAKDGCVARDNPPQREWQGLTDEEMRSFWDEHVVPMFGRKHMNPIVFGRIIETKLKEKNT